MSTDLDLRYRHDTGHTISDMLMLRIHDLEGFRIPDVVVYQRDARTVVLCARAARDRDRQGAGRLRLHDGPLLDIVVAAVLRLHATSATVRSDSVLLRDWAHGLALLKLVCVLPAAQRLASL